MKNLVAIVDEENSKITADYVNRIFSESCKPYRTADQILTDIADGSEYSAVFIHMRQMTVPECRGLIKKIRIFCPLVPIVAVGKNPVEEATKNLDFYADKKDYIETIRIFIQ